MDSTTHDAANGQIPLPEGVSPEQLLEILALLKDLRYGSVQIIVQDGVIVQIDRTEKKRIVRNHAAPRNPPAS